LSEFPEVNWIHTVLIATAIAFFLVWWFFKMEEKHKKGWWAE
jgi:hypothetical protein